MQLNVSHRKADERDMKSRFLLSAFFFFALTSTAQAEYRVFVLKISKRATDPKAPPSQDFRLVTSTLDPDQYRGYYPVALDEVVTYTDTWICEGRTDGFKDFCPNPKGQKDAEPASTP